ncbi:hypothetical protein FJ959_22315 [Mesorhizobium sp. B2-2-4]|uniref:hypothetical protein n=1 Tax=unclassified Mesorhizobium TaxID=325217 RepID=UPI00112E083C|nr:MULTISPECIES: hypothetical protein [unclassified Mesorhizobium]TPM53266.1 hypothetical protein FJ959_22315 [Mesorhizobium sp. B2-2-4]TPM62091.1 hypothetical protein FJ965_21055 [Mesorhizobium sp. B2-2-1]TPN68462.1 hypothetical protein FJ984_11535 [Mesorhizobium sp. B1-1-3]
MKPDKFDDPEQDLTIRKRLLVAYEALEDGNADRDQARLILQHLAGLTGYYKNISLAQWVKDTGSASGFEAACIEHQAKRWVFSEILPFLTKHVDGKG